MTSNKEIVNRLNTVIDLNMEKYSYFTARYLNDAAFSFRSVQDYSDWNYSFDLRTDSDLYSSGYINVIKSIIDTASSKIATQKVRPYFTPVNGLYKTRQTVRAIQEYFDNIYEQCNIHAIMSEAFRDGCINGKGYVWINPITYEISVLKPHTVAFLESEVKYGAPKRMLVKYIDFPTYKLSDYGVEKPRIKSTQCTLWHYIDAVDHVQEIFVDGKSVKSTSYKPDILPVIELFYTKPVFGTHTTSLVQELDGIQTQIDIISAKISAATQLNACNTTYVMEGSNLAAKDIDNRVGKVFSVKMPPGINTPPVVNVPPPLFDSQWFTLLEMYIQKAYDVTGISQLSAQSKKPAGADSGVALQTLEDVEGDRLEIAMNNYIQSYTDLAKVIIEVLPENKSVLPESLNNSSLKWKDVKEQSNLFKIQYSTATAFSKNPAEKVKQIMGMYQAGLISQAQIAEYMDMPDLRTVYDKASASQDGVEQCIQRAIEYEDYDIPDFVNYQQLAQEIALEENRLYAEMTDDKENNEIVEDSIIRLMKLEEALLQVMNENGFVDLSEETTVTPEGEEIQGTTEVADITNDVKPQDIDTSIEQPVDDSDEMANPVEIS